LAGVLLKLERIDFCALIFIFSQEQFYAPFCVVGNRSVLSPSTRAQSNEQPPHPPCRRTCTCATDCRGRELRRQRRARGHADCQPGGRGRRGESRLGSPCSLWFIAWLTGLGGLLPALCLPYQHVLLPALLQPHTTHAPRTATAPHRLLVVRCASRLTQTRCSTSALRRRAQTWHRWACVCLCIVLIWGGL
jgi:hypothetical protein